MLFCEFSKIKKNTLITEHLQTTVSKFGILMLTDILMLIENLVKVKKFSTPVLVLFFGYLSEVRTSNFVSLISHQNFMGRICV